MEKAGFKKEAVNSAKSSGRSRKERNDTKGKVCTKEKSLATLTSMVFLRDIRRSSVAELRGKEEVRVIDE